MGWILEFIKVSKTSPSHGAQQECSNTLLSLLGVSIIGLVAVFIDSKMAFLKMNGNPVIPYWTPPLSLGSSNLIMQGVDLSPNKEFHKSELR